MITKEKARKRIKKLRDTIDQQRYRYHVLDTQDISDAAHDSLKHELFILEQQFPDLITPTSPTQRVGGKPLDTFKKVTHRTSMLSMEDIFNREELDAWLERLKRLKPHARFHYFTEVKMDGLAVSLRYQDSVFICGATRGDGKIGEDVTHNLKTIDAIPLHLRVPTEKEIAAFLRTHRGCDAKKIRERLISLKGDIEIRGEVFMSKSTFDTLNKEQQQKGGSQFANPRNAAAGTIRQLNPRVVASRRLDFYGYALMNEDTFGISTHEQAHDLMKLLGVKTNPLSESCTGNSDVQEYYDRLQKKREHLPYWIDGVVVVVNENNVFYSLGVVGKAPRGLIAYKFPAEQVTTIIEEVHFQVGRTGALTPVAQLRPVGVGGTTVSHATLHNIDEIKRLDVHIGDTVIIEKAGDIIPKVISVIKTMRTGEERKISIPRRCPMCHSKVIRSHGEVALYCTNKTCFAKEKERIGHFVSRKAFDIDGLGEKIIEQLINTGLIHSAADLFTLKRGDIESLERFGKKSAENLISAIDARRIIEFPRLLYALGIRHVGEETAYDLASHFGTLHAIHHASLETLECVSNIGIVVAKSIHDYFQDERNLAFLKELLEHGVQIKSVKKTIQTFSGMTFVFTGTLSSLTRDDAKKKIREHGGDVSSSVSKETDYVVFGDNPGSKYHTAKKLGVTVLTEKEFIALLGE